jgi:hypothetical protein
MPEEKKRVDFNAPISLVERADSIAEVLDRTRTDFLISALEDEIEKLKQDERFRQKIKNAYYNNRIDHDVVEDILGYEEAMRLKLLRDSIDRNPPEPHPEDSPPSDEEFYDGEMPAWTADGGPSTEDG